MSNNTDFNVNDAIHYIDLLRKEWGDYHARKENMAYILSGLYMGGCLSLNVPGEVASICIWLKILLCICVVTIGLLIFFIVRSQFKNMRLAANIVAACTTLRTLWTLEKPNREDFEPMYIREYAIPKVVKQYADKIERSIEYHRPFEIAKNSMYLVLLIISIIVIIRIVVM